MKRASALLPDSLRPVGINRDQPAALIGIGPSLFDRLIIARKMPEPRPIAGRLIWDVEEVAAAFRALPHRCEPVSSLDHTTPAVNSWD
ncbi:MAG: hypothetical protein EOR99_31015 [Mesorhizobium sp.]|nr:MAG: hypothetical protein EOR99_31015 [Mesorhizobium sp.]